MQPLRAATSIRMQRDCARQTAKNSLSVVDSGQDRTPVMRGRRIIASRSGSQGAHRIVIDQAKNTLLVFRADAEVCTRPTSADAASRRAWAWRPAALAHRQT